MEVSLTTTVIVEVRIKASPSRGLKLVNDRASVVRQEGVRIKVSPSRGLKLGKRIRTDAVGSSVRIKASPSRGLKLIYDMCSRADPYG